MRPLPGITADVVDDQAQSVPQRRRRLPGAARAVAVDAAHDLGRRPALHRHLLVALRRAGTCYFAGDGAKKDEDGDLWLLGRVDDVMLVSGHNISTTEVESALVVAPEGGRGGRGRRDRPDDRPGHRGVRDPARHGADGGRASSIAELRDHVAKTLGPIAKPRQILLVAELPKTRSGKIMRRLLRDVAENR